MNFTGVVRDPMTRTWRGCIRCASALGLALAAASALGAQSTRGSTFVVGVADAETGQPLEGAEVILLSSYRVARTNRLGEVTMPNVFAGVQRVRVRHIGYAPLEIDVVVKGDTAGAVFRLQHVVTRLETVTIDADWVPPKMKDVEVRRRQGIGRFIDAPQFAKEADRDFSLVAAFRFPGLMAVPDSEGHLKIASSRTTFSISNNKGTARLCYPEIYLDDILVTSIQDIIRTWDLATVEFYTGLQVPVRYRSHNYGCGVLLLWSKWS